MVLTLNMSMTKTKVIMLHFLNFKVVVGGYNKKKLLMAASL